jgi:hypothetical protein
MYVESERLKDWVTALPSSRLVGSAEREEDWGRERRAEL